PVPIGVPGELYIGGDSVGRGYLNRPDLTAQRFLPDPFSQEAGSRMYRTGDRGRYLADGNLEFLGRTDQQVKVRGFRVELKEIEVVLARHSAVEQAAVLATVDGHDSVRLIAYAVRRSDANVKGHDLRQYLRDHLPEYMIPAAVTLLEQMPLTASGK